MRQQPRKNKNVILICTESICVKIGDDSGTDVCIFLLLQDELQKLYNEGHARLDSEIYSMIAFGDKAAQS